MPIIDVKEIKYWRCLRWQGRMFTERAIYGSNGTDIISDRGTVPLNERTKANCWDFAPWVPQPGDWVLNESLIWHLVRPDDISPCWIARYEEKEDRVDINKCTPVLDRVPLIGFDARKQEEAAHQKALEDQKKLKDRISQWIMSLFESEKLKPMRMEFDDVGLIWFPNQDRLTWRMNICHRNMNLFNEFGEHPKPSEVEAWVFSILWPTQRQAQHLGRVLRKKQRREAAIHDAEKWIEKTFQREGAWTASQFFTWFRVSMCATTIQLSCRVLRKGRGKELTISRNMSEDALGERLVCFLYDALEEIWPKKPVDGSDQAKCQRHYEKTKLYGDEKEVGHACICKERSFILGNHHCATCPLHTDKLRENYTQKEMREMRNTESPAPNWVEELYKDRIVNKNRDCPPTIEVKGKDGSILLAPKPKDPAPRPAPHPTEEVDSKIAACLDAARCERQAMAACEKRHRMYVAMAEFYRSGAAEKICLCTHPHKEIASDQHDKLCPMYGEIPF